MPLIVAFILAALLSTIALVHLYWAMGGIWPARNESDLVNTVLGVPGVTKMPSRMSTLVVVFALALAAVWPLLINGVLANPVPRLALTLIGIAIAAIFWIRGFAGYLPKFRAHFSGEPFATLDRFFFSPLSLSISVGYFYVLFFTSTA